MEAYMMRYIYIFFYVVIFKRLVILLLFIIFSYPRSIQLYLLFSSYYDRKHQSDSFFLFFPSFLPWCSLFSVYFKIYFYYLKVCECICACGWGYTYLCRYFRRFEPLEPLDLKYQVVASILYEYWEPNSGPLKDQYSLLAMESLSRSPSPLSVFWARALYSFD